MSNNFEYRDAEPVADKALMVAAEAMGEVDNLKRVTSTPVPAGILTDNFTASKLDQRLIHSSENNHTLVMPSAKDLYERRGIIRNSMRAGTLTITGRFVASTLESTKIIENPVLNPGEGIEYLGYFDISSTPDAKAPDDFRLNGELHPGLDGKYRIAIIVYDRANYTKEQLDTKFTELLAITNAAKSKADFVDAGLNSTNAVVSALSSSLISAANRIAALEKYKVSFGISNVSLPLLALNAAKDVTINFAQSLPSTNYDVIQFSTNVFGVTLTNLTFTEKSRTASSITYTIKNTGLAITNGSFTLVVHVQGR